MSANALFLTNVICPLLSGIPLLCFAFYFFYAGQGLFRQRARLFPLFLLAFSLYILGRPVQLLMGPYPWPVIVNCLRFAIFAGVCCPLVLHEARALCGVKGRRARLGPMLAVGGGLSAVYTLAMLVGPTETPVAFELGGLKAYECVPPGLTPPLFPREVTILALAAAGVGFFGLAGYETLKARRALAGTRVDSRHLLDFAVGCLIFGAAVLLGTLAKQWWFYYLASVPAAFFIGLGVREDMLYVRRRVERVTPFLRDELFHALSSGPSQDIKVRDLKELLGKRVSPTLVLAIGSEAHGGMGDALLTFQESVRQRLTKVLDAEVGEADYLLLPLGPSSFAVCLDAGEDDARKLAEKLRACLAVESGECDVRVGIGGRHPPEDLQHSFFEAQTALRAAERAGQPLVSYIDLGALPSLRSFPVEARDEFLLEFKHAHQDAARRRLQVLLDLLKTHAQDNVVAYRVRLLELLGTVLGVLGEQGSDDRALLAAAASAFEKLNRLETTGELTDAFTRTIDKLLTQVEAPRVETTSVNPLPRAKAYIDDNLAEDLKIADVAKRAFVSVSQLQRLFRESLGMTYSDYLTTVRMQKAKALLAGTDRPITDIAFEVGYNDSNYFSTAFRKHEGLSPSRYRKQG